MFNTTEQRDYFINPGCFGDDLAAWFKEKLPSAAPGDVDQEDFGWYLPLRYGGKDYFLVMGFREDEDDSRWIVWIERQGALRMFTRRESKGIDADLVRIVHDTLTGESAISDVRWHKKSDFDRNRQESGTTTPMG